EKIGVSQAAFAVGYSSAGQFIRDYREFFGATPLQDARAR
ncbi:MAG TPA: AraC family transcriptional regulator, partial [Sutterella sp.]|nr:AraC family transcriptional regulator [Sutterella sp.]